MEPLTVLQEFGLTLNEAKTYLSLVNSGSADVSHLSKTINIHRINIYDILKRLQEKGLVSYVIVDKKKYYQAVNPNKILEMQEEKTNNLKKAIKHINKSKIYPNIKQDAMIFKDKKGIKTLLNDMTKSKSEVLLFASGWGFKENFPEYYNIWHKKFKINNVKIKALISSKYTKLKIPKNLNYKFLPSNFNFTSTTAIYDNKVIIIMWSKHIVAILVKSKDVYNSYKNFFDLLWKISKVQSPK